MQYAVLVTIGLLALGSAQPPSAPPSPDPRNAAHHGIADGRSKAPSDAKIKRRIIAESIAAYDGPCACPYQRARNGSSCGHRSAYTREGGESPLCYARDVTAEMVAEYRAAHGLD